MRSSKAPRVSDSIDKMLGEWQRERPELEAAPLGIVGRLLRLNTLLLRRIEEWLIPFGLTWENFSMLVTLRRSGPPYALTPTSLSQESLLTSGAITSRIDRIVALGFAKRLPDPSDRRGVLVQLTPKGKKLADQAIATHFENLDGTLDDLTSGERAKLTALLTKLLHGLESRPS